MDKDDFIRIDLNNITISEADTIIIENWDTMNTSIASSPSDYITIDTNFADIDLSFISNWQLEQEWREINEAAKTNEALQKAIERVKILYHLSRDDGNSET